MSATDVINPATEEVLQTVERTDEAGVDDAVARVYASYLDSLAPAWDGGAAGPRGRTAFVVLGLGGGETAIRIETEDGSVTLDVTVAP